MAKLIAVFLTIIASAAAWSPFLVPTMLSHQPIGSLPGEVNYYRIAFDVRSKNSGSTKSGYCAKFWGDNSELDPEPYSVYVPVDQWIQCDSAVDTYDSDSAFQFKLFPYFSIGNFSLEVKEQLHGDRTITGFKHIRNDTDRFTCYTPGDCSIPEGHWAIKIPVP